MKLCLIRHGETVFNIDDRMQGVRDIELSPRGKREAVLLGDRLREAGILPRRVYSSPVKRAFDTAVGLGYGVPVRTLAGFRSRTLGELEGLTKPEIRVKFPGALEKLLEWDWRPPGGDESLGDLFRRASADLMKLQDPEAASGFTLIVTHSGVLEALMRGWLRLKPVDPLPFVLKNAAAILCQPEDPVWKPERIIAAGEGENVDHS